MPRESDGYIIEWIILLIHAEWTIPLIITTALTDWCQHILIKL